MAKKNTKTDGTVINGKTVADGYTPKISTENPRAVAARQNQENVDKIAAEVAKLQMDQKDGTMTLKGKGKVPYEGKF